MNKFVVTSAPFVRSANDINKMFLYMCATLTLPAVYGVMFFGISSLYIILASVVSCFVAELLYNLIAKRNFKIDSISFLVTALILSLTMPVKMPIYIVAFPAFFAVFVVKLVFGGVGRNVFNPALVGRCLAGVMASELGSEIYSFTLKGETLTSLSNGGTNTIVNLITGNAVGGIGTTCVIMIAIALIFLIYSDIIDWKLPILSFLAYMAVAINMETIEIALMNVFSGSFLFVSVFMITDPNTSPNSLLGKIIYSVSFGALSAFVWEYGFLGENTVFVVALFVNLFVPILDKYTIIKHKALGGYRNAYKN